MGRAGMRQVVKVDAGVSYAKLALKLARSRLLNGPERKSSPNIHGLQGQACQCQKPLPKWDPVAKL